VERSLECTPGSTGGIYSTDKLIHSDPASFKLQVHSQYFRHQHISFFFCQKSCRADVMTIMTAMMSKWILNVDATGIFSCYNLFRWNYWCYCI